MPHRQLLDPLGRQDQLALRATPDLQGQTVWISQDLPVLMDPREHKAQLDQQESVAFLDPSDLSGLQDLKDPLALMDCLLLDQLDLQGPLDLEGLLALLVHKAQQVLLDRL